MYILKNAIKNIRRNMGRNMFLAVIMLGIITISCVSLVINNTAQNVMVDYKAKFGSEVFISLNQEEYAKHSQGSDGSISLDFPEIPADVTEKMTTSKYIASSSVRTFMNAYSDTLKPVKSENKDGFSSSTTIGEDDTFKSKPTQFYLRGYSNVGQEEKFKNKKRSLTSGELPSKENECIVSEKLAKENNLKVGDTIKIKNTMETNEKKEKLEELSLVVSGIYQYEVEKPQPGMLSIGIEDNEIFTNYKILNDPKYAFSNTLDATYYLKNPDDLKSFEKESKALGLPAIYDVTTDVAGYNQVVGPIEKLGSLSFLFLCVVIILGALIILLLSMLAIRERKYEIGVLRAMGMKKIHVASQMLCESLVIMFVCLIVGGGIGAVAAQPVANTMLESQIAKGDEGMSSGMSAGGGMYMSVVGGNMTNENAIKEIKVVVSPITIVQLSGIALLLVIIASCISSIYITKYEPIRILSERN